MSTAETPFDVTTWDQHLLPLLRIFKRYPRKNPNAPPVPSPTRFVDSLGNYLDLGGGQCSPSFFKERLATLLERRKTGMFEVKDLDDGYLYFVVQELEETPTAPKRWVVSEASLDCGYGSTTYVVVDEAELVKLIEMIQSSIIMSTPAIPFDIATWDQHLLPLLKVFKSQDRPKRRNAPPPVASPTRFVDSLGNHLDLDGTAPWCFQDGLVSLLEKRKTGMYEPEDLDKGHLYFVVQKLAKTTTAPTRWVVSSVAFDLYGDCGGSTDAIVVGEDEMVKLIEMLMSTATAFDATTIGDTHLLPLLKIFKSRNLAEDPNARPPTPYDWRFIDSHGRTLDFADHCGWQLDSFKAGLGSLLEARQDGFYELDVDDGHCFYVVKKYDEHWVVSSVTYDLYGESGGSTNFVVVDEEGMKRLERVVRELKDEEE